MQQAFYHNETSTSFKSSCYLAFIIGFESRNLSKYSTITDNINANNSCLCETLFIKGNDSDYILAEHREAINSLFKNVSAKIIHGAGHWLHAQKPQAVNKAINDFLTAV